MLWPNGSTVRPHVSSSFGPRSAPVAGASRVHRGTDFTGFSYVRSIAPGRVVVVGAPGGWGGGGTQVWVQHDGFFTRSMHLRAGSTQVRVGQWVEAGQVLGAMGMTGTASGVHHHLEVTPGNVHYSNTGQVDSVPFISNRLSAPSGGGGTPIIPPVPKEDDMLALLIDGKHKCTLAPAVFSHMIQADNPDRVKDIVTAEDKYVPTTLAELPVLLARHGVDLHIWDVRGGKFVVLNPLDGSVREGNTWSAWNAIRSSVAAVKVTSEETKAYVEQLTKAE